MKRTKQRETYSMNILNNEIISYDEKLNWPLIPHILSDMMRTPIFMWDKLVF
jgi:hypothetical protein